MAKDRDYQFWERNSLSIELRSAKVFIQKLEYLHNNPVKAGLCINPGDYYYSSARFYETGIDDFSLGSCPHEPFFCLFFFAYSNRRWPGGQTAAF